MWVEKMCALVKIARRGYLKGLRRMAFFVMLRGVNLTGEGSVSLKVFYEINARANIIMGEF